MLGRPRTISDEAIFEALAVAIGKVGPARLTLADVAVEAGVTAGAIAQRFGSKRHLLLSFVRAGNPAGRFRTALAASSGSDRLARIIDALATTSAFDRITTPEEFANHLAFLHLDVSDPEFRIALAGQEDALRAEVHAALGGAAETLTLAGALLAMRHGAQISWAISRIGTPRSVFVEALQTLLAPYDKETSSA